MRKFLSDFLPFLHFGSGLFWCGLFFLPISWWPGKISFHFFLTITILSHQFLWGAMIRPWTGKYRLVCVFTTITQLLRGLPISDPKNYNHSFTKELFGKVGVTLTNRAIAIFTLTIFTLVTIQYLFFNS